MKDDDNALQPKRQPGPLGELLGGRVEQYYALNNPVPIEGQWGVGESPFWAELLSVKDKDTEVLMHYGKSNGWLNGQPAAITRKVGKGRVTYIGAWLDPKTMARAAKWMATISSVSTPLPNVPPGVEASVRQGPRGVVYILLNLSQQPQTIRLPSLMRDVLEGSSKSSLNLPVYGVAVLAQPQ